jgi:hypothetical protein
VVLDEQHPTAHRSPIRTAAGIVGVAATSALLGLGQLWVARQLGVLDLAEEWYISGNDFWPFQLFLLALFAAGAAAVAVALLWPLVHGRTRWPVRVAATIAALAGASACLPLVRSWSAAAEGVTDPVGEATRAALVGLLAGAAAAMVSTLVPAVRHGLVAWLWWIWVTNAAATATGTPTTPFGLLPTPEAGGAGSAWLSLLTPLALITALGAWAARRGQRLPVLGAVSGPLLQAVVAAGLVAFHGMWGDHYDLGSELIGGILFALLGGALATGAVGWVRARSRRTAGPAGTGLDTGAGLTLLRVAGFLLIAAGLLQPSGVLGLGSPVLVATGALAVVVGVVAGRHRILGQPAGVALAGGAWVAASLLQGWRLGEVSDYFVHAAPVELPIVVVVALLGGRSVRSAAAWGLAVVAAGIGWMLLALWYGGAGDQVADVVPGTVLALAAAALLLTPAVRSSQASRGSVPVAGGPAGQV